LPNGAGAWCTVRDRDVPCRWEIQGQVEGGGSGTGRGRWQRDYYLRAGAARRRHDLRAAFVYTASNPLLALLERLALPTCNLAESAEAFRRLKRALEEVTE
jgi:hypothetical protein